MTVSLRLLVEMEVIIKPDGEEVCKEAARIFRQQIRRKRASVLGLATGSTPLPFYKELVSYGEKEDLDFSEVVTFNLDEYVGLKPEHPHSYTNYMLEHFFSKVNVWPHNLHIPDGMAPSIPQHCDLYERQIKEAGGIDLQLLGLGSDGHIGFNEPSSSLSSRTRLKTLTQQTLQDNEKHFAPGEKVPRHVITMGVGTIMEAKQCVMIAFGEKKAAAVAKTVEGPITADVPSSVLQMHERCTLIIDEAAASELKRQEYYRWVYHNKPAWQRV